MADGSNATEQVLGGVKKPKRKVFWPEVQHEVAEYFGYEPRVAACNPEGGAPTAPFGRHLQYANGATHSFMSRVYDRLRRADEIMPYRNDGKRRRPSASMTLRAAYGATATAYDDSAPGDAQKWLRDAQTAYAQAATEVGPRAGPSLKDRILRRFDLVFCGAMQRFVSDENG